MWECDLKDRLSTSVATEYSMLAVCQSNRCCCRRANSDLEFRGFDADCLRARMGVLSVWIFKDWPKETSSSFGRRASRDAWRMATRV